MSNGSSPIPVTKPINTFDFPTAIKNIIEGEKVTKQEWNDKNIYGVLANGFLMLHKKDGKLAQWIVSDGDLMGNDWEILK